MARRTPSAQNSTDFVSAEAVAAQCTMPLRVAPSAMLDAAVGLVTTAVAADVAVACPAVELAVTATRSVEPASAVAAV